MSTKITKSRLWTEDNEVLKIISLKLSAEKMRVVTTKDVIHGVVRSFGTSREESVEGIINAIRDEI